MLIRTSSFYEMSCSSMPYLIVKAANGYTSSNVFVWRPYMILPSLMSLKILLNLQNYSSIITVHPEVIDGRPGTMVIESFVVDVPDGNTKDETCYFVEALIKCNLKSLANVSERLAVQDRTEPIDRIWSIWSRLPVQWLLFMQVENVMVCCQKQIESFTYYRQSFFFFIICSLPFHHLDVLSILADKYDHLCPYAS